MLVMETMMLQKLIQKVKQLFDDFKHYVIETLTALTVLFTLIGLFLFMKSSKTKTDIVIGNDDVSENDIKIGETKQQANDANEKAKQQANGVSLPNTFEAADDLLKKINDKK